MWFSKRIWYATLSSYNVDKWNKAVDNNKLFGAILILTYQKLLIKKVTAWFTNNQMKANHWKMSPFAKHTRCKNPNSKYNYKLFKITAIIRYSV